jgi:hypothetical protein
LTPVRNLKGVAAHELELHVRVDAAVDNAYGMSNGGPDGALYVLTSNLDAWGVPPPYGDRVLRLSFVAP